MNREDASNDGWTINQIVAYRIAKAREHRGWTQQQAADQLAPFLGRVLSPASFSAIERSFLGGRIRHFDADEIVAMAKGFDLPVVWFFTPPPRPGIVTLGEEPLCVNDPVRLLLGTSQAFELWQGALLELSSTQAASQHQAATLDRVRHHVSLRSTLGDLDEARRVIGKVSELLDALDRSAQQ